MAELDDVAKNQDMVNIANAIRRITKTSGTMTIPQMPERLTSIRVIEDKVVEVNFGAESPVSLGEYDNQFKHFFIVMPKANTDAESLNKVQPEVGLVYDEESGELFMQYEKELDVDVELHVLDLLLADDADTDGVVLAASGGAKILPYSSLSSYDAGDVFIFENSLGLTLVAHGPEAFSTAHNALSARMFVKQGVEPSLMDVFDVYSELLQEVEDRQDADTALGTRVAAFEIGGAHDVSALESRVSSVEGDIDDLAQEIEDEADRAKQAEQDLDDKIDAIDFPVDSVNGKTGTVVLKDNDIHIYTDSTNTKTVHSEFERVDENVERVEEEKLDKVETTNDKVVVYSVQNEEQGTIEVSNSPEEGAIPMYDTNGNIKSGTPSAANDVINKGYADNAYAPLSFVSNLYGTMSGGNLVRLTDTPPVADPNNILQLLGSTNTDYDWTTPSIVLERKVEVDTKLVNNNSLTITLKYKTNRDVTISWGAKVLYSADGTSWEALSTNQSFNAVSIVADEGGTSTDLIVFADAIVGTKTVAKDSYLRVQLFKKAGDSASLNTLVYFGVNEDNAYVGTFAQFNFANVRINTEQLEDGSVTAEKLSDGLNNTIAGKLDKVTSSSSADRAYVAKANGTQNVMNISSEATGSTLATRDSNGNLKVATPTDDAHASTKKYVDDGLAEKMDDSKAAIAAAGGLVLPASAPSTKQVVTIGTDGTQGSENFPTPTTVVANPTLAGTEDDLTGLQVGGTKFKVPSGGSYTFTNGVTESGGVVSVDSTIARANAYLPLSGGKMTGYLDMDRHNFYLYKPGTNDAYNVLIYSGSTTTKDVNFAAPDGWSFKFASGGVYHTLCYSGSYLGPYGYSASYPQSLGTASSRWTTLYCINLSDGTTTKSMSTILGLTTSKLDATKTAVANVGGLTTLSSSPSNPELVGISTSNAQSRVSVGSGLSLSGGVLSAQTPNAIQEIRALSSMQFWVGTQSQYDALPSHPTTVIYILTGE